MLQVTALTGRHNCHSSSRMRTATPTANWVAGHAIRILSENPTISCVALHKQVQKEQNCVLSYDMAYQGMQKALDELHGTWDDSFRLLFRWKAAILEKMPDSVIEIEVEDVEGGKVLFKRFFCAFGPCLRGWREGCRPYLAVDATSLNGRWAGHLPSAVGVDGHHWMYPVAFGFFEGENDESWLWFMEQLQKAIGDVPDLAICSDAHKSLLKAKRSVFPHAEDRECFLHLHKNFKKYHVGDHNLWPAARSYTTEVFHEYYSNVIGLPGVEAWFNEHHTSLWYRCGFNPAIKCDYITNNIAEVCSLYHTLFVITT
jgi:hypothetical protein